MTGDDNMSEKEEIKEETIEEVAEEPSEAEVLKAELDKQKDDYLRLLAEYDNFKKRADNLAKANSG